RSDELRTRGAEVVEGDLLNPASVQAAMRDVKRAYFTYPVADGLLEAVAIFAAAARDAGVELVVNNSQFQGRPGEPALRHLQHAPTFPNLQIAKGGLAGPSLKLRDRKSTRLNSRSSPTSYAVISLTTTHH